MYCLNVECGHTCIYLYISGLSLSLSLRPPTRFTEENTDSQYVQYDLDDMDINWLERVNLQRKFRGISIKIEV